MTDMIKRRELQDLEHSVGIRKIFSLVLFVLNILLAYYVIAALVFEKVKIT